MTATNLTRIGHAELTGPENPCSAMPAPSSHIAQGSQAEAPIRECPAHNDAPSQ
jgi:hypothetical protein